MIGKKLQKFDLVIRAFGGDASKPRRDDRVARELPAGRGFLRVIDGGLTKPGIVNAFGPRPEWQSPVKEVPRRPEQLSLFDEDD